MTNTAIPVHVDAIAKSYGRAAVLSDIAFSLTPGEMFGLIGLNGAGKTTLIKIMLDLASADKGTVSLFGISSKDPKARRNLCYLPEKFQPSRYLKGMEYLALSLAYYGKSLDRDIVRKYAANLDLRPEALDLKVNAYSKGMGQKLGLLGALMTGVPLLVLDEPMSGLDPSARILLKDQLTQFKREGHTVFFSSHILSDIDEICDRIAILHHGRLLFTGQPAQFKQLYGESSLERAFLAAIKAL